MPVSVMPVVKVGECSPLALVVAADFGESEIENLHRAVGLDPDVGGLQVAMRDARVVRGFERIGDLRAMRRASSSGSGPSGDSPSMYSMTR